MVRKSFEELTISDDFMFCKVMEQEPICKEFLEMLFSAKIKKITYLSSQNSITTNSGAKNIRLDVLVKDEADTSYNIEMQVANQYNLSKRMRYYQAALDISFLDQGYSYKALNDSFIIFICLFDPVGKNKAIYTFENICIEDKTILLQDGTKKVILNAKAFNQAGNHDLQGFLRYVKTGEVTTGYTERIEQMIQMLKQNELARREYHILPVALMDAFDEGEAHGSRQKALETAKLMLQHDYPVAEICLMTGLSSAEVEAL